MEKPKHTNEPGTIKFRLIEEDWSRKSIYQMVDELNSTYDSLKGMIRRIKQETGYQVTYLHLPTHKNEQKTETFLQPVVMKKKAAKTPNNCDTCWNTDCVFMSKRKAVLWKNCDGWIGENR